MAQDVALHLVTTYTSERIELQAMHYEWAREQKRADGPGWLVKAIERGYDPPQEVQDRYDQEHKTAKERYVGEYGDLIDH
jgi:hypothetical protein